MEPAMSIGLLERLAASVVTQASDMLRFTEFDRNKLP
jgi:hypothetical protein